MPPGALPASLYSSPPFKFIVEGAEFYIHLGLIANASRPFKELTTGNMKEAQELKASIEEVDQETFDRFSQWLYKGYYGPAPHTMEDRQETTDTLKGEERESPAKDPKDNLILDEESLPAMPPTYTKKLKGREWASKKIEISRVGSMGEFSATSTRVRSANFITTTFEGNLH